MKRLCPGILEFIVFFKNLIAISRKNSKSEKKPFFLGFANFLPKNVFFADWLHAFCKSFVKYFLLCNKKSRCDFDDKLKVGDVRYKHLTQITIKVQLF